MLGVVIKPILVHLIVKYEYKEIMLMIGHCAVVTIMACFVPSVISKVLNPNTIIGFLGIGFISMISLGLVIWFIGLDKNMKKMLLNWVKEKIYNHKKE